MNQVFNEIYKQVWEEVFPGEQMMEMAMFKDKYASDLGLPIKYPCAFTGEDVWCTSEYGYKRFMGDTERLKRMNEGNNLQEKVPMDDLNQVIEAAKKVAYFRGNKTVNSEVVEESDNVYSSSYILNSTFIQSSTKLLFCRDMGPNEYMLASKNSKNCSFGIRVMDCDSVNNSFEVSFSGKCSNCYFCHNSFDLRDCMFCFDIASKQYCIANIQLDEAEYKATKERILKEYFGQLDKQNAMRVLADIG